ncbi:hypothetical protein K1719_039883 [Acacia pycnantha]|nr:hypothetical protein K1719_039883 [Acacia pycnantha]
MTKQDGTMHKLKTKMTIKDYDLILHKSTLKMLNESEKANICEDFDKRGNGHDDLEEGPPQSTSFNGELIHSDRGQIQGDAKHQERIQVGSSFVSNWDNEDLHMIQHVFECLRLQHSYVMSPTSRTLSIGEN